MSLSELEQFVASLPDDAAEALRSDPELQQRVFDEFNKEPEPNLPTIPARSAGLEPLRDESVIDPREVKKIPRDVPARILGAGEKPSPPQPDIQESPDPEAEKWLPQYPTSFSFEGGELIGNSGWDMEGWVKSASAGKARKIREAIETADDAALGSILQRDMEYAARKAQNVDIYSEFDPDYALWLHEEGLLTSPTTGEVLSKAGGAMMSVMKDVLAIPGMAGEWTRDVARGDIETAANKLYAATHAFAIGQVANMDFLVPRFENWKKVEGTGTLLQGINKTVVDDNVARVRKLFANEEGAEEIDRQVFLASYKNEFHFRDHANNIQKQVDAVVERAKVDPQIAQSAMSVADIVEPADLVAAGVALKVANMARFRDLVGLPPKGPVVFANYAAEAERIADQIKGLSLIEGRNAAAITKLENITSGNPGKGVTVIQPLDATATKALKRSIAEDTARVARKRSEIAEHTKDFNSRVAASRDATMRELDDALAPGVGHQLTGRAVEKAAGGVHAVGAGIERLGKFLDDTVAKIATEKGTQDLLKAGVHGKVMAPVVGSIAGGIPGMVAGLGVSASGVTNPQSWYRLANTMREAGRLYRIAPNATKPFFQRVAANSEGLPKLAAAGLSRASQWVPQQTAKHVGRGVVAAGKGAAISGAITFAGTQNIEHAAESAGAITGIVGVMGAGQSFVAMRGVDNTARLSGDARQYKESLSPEQKKKFESLPVSDQWQLSQRASIYGDLALEFYDGGSEWGSWNPDRRVARINTKNKQAPLHFALAHEAGHYLHDHGLTRSITDEIIGSPDTRQPGMYSENADGLAVVENGVVKTNAEFRRLKESYVAKRNPESVDPVTGKPDPKAVDSMSDTAVAMEIFAEQVADRLLSPDLVTADARGGPHSLFANLDWFESPGFVGDLLGSLGFAIDQRGAMVEGTGLFKTPDGSPAVPRNTKLEAIIKDYNRRAARGHEPDWNLRGDVVVTPEVWAKNPDALKAFQASSDVSVDPVTGKINGTEVDENGKLTIVDRALIFNTPAQIKETSKEMVDTIRKVTADLAAAGKLDPDVLQERRFVDENGKETTELSGRYLPDEVLVALRESKKFNPYQLDTLEQVNAEMKARSGQPFTFSYQPRMARGKKGYKSLPQGWRTEIPYTIFISQANNVLFRTVSPEKILENARREVAKGKARLWDNNLAAVTRDLNTYLDNLADGKPGDEGIGAEKKNFLNNILGIRTKGTQDVNPFFTLPGKSPDIVITARRLDAINRIVTSDGRKVAFTAEAYNRAKLNLRPGEKTETPEFKAWFGESKVADATGSPVVVYHGTGAKFSRFNTKKHAQGIIWFTSDKSKVEKGEVGAAGKGQIMPLYASIQNPAGWAEYDRLGLYEFEGRGFDGAILPDGDGGFDGFVFESRQLKSVDNAGEFDPANPNIMHRPGEDSGFTPEEAERIRKGGERAVEQSVGRLGVVDREAGTEVGSSEPQLAGERLPNAVEADELKIIHFSGRPGLSSIDPKHFGKGHATALDQRGDPKSYFFVQGSEYGADAGLVTGDQKPLYGATISGARIYDMNADALGILNEPNRQTRDETLKAAGYAGLSILTTDNRNVVALFEPVGVKALQSDTQQFRPNEPIVVGDIGPEGIRMKKGVDLDHEQLGFDAGFDGSGYGWRFNPRLKELFWWNERPDRRTSDAVVLHLESKGFEVRKETVIDGENTATDRAHGVMFRPGDVDPAVRHPGHLLPDAKPPTKKAVEEVVKHYGLTDAEADAYRLVADAERNADESALPIAVQYDDAGRPKFDVDIETSEYVLKVSPIRYDFVTAPEIMQIRDRHDAAFAKRLEGKSKAEIKAAKAARDKHSWVDEGTTLLAGRLVAEAKKAMAEESVQAGIGWYSKMRGWLQNRFGAGIEVFSQLLGATSARTPVDENFKQSLDAIKRLSRGDYDDILTRFDEHVAPIKKQLEAGAIDEDTARKQINSFVEFPTRSNGKKFNANSQKVLHVLYGNWLEQTVGPKTPNFAGNLSGRSLKATIDVWAARTARRLLYQNKTYNPETGRISNAANKWRIRPEAETGVEFSRLIGREIGGDFGFAQEAFQKAADELGMEADDLQALMWFHEKHVWDVNGWTNATGKKKSSFEEEAAKLITDRFQFGLTTFTTPEASSPEAFRKELAATRDAIVENPAVVYARVTESQGLYGGSVEPAFDAEFTVSAGADVSGLVDHVVTLGAKYTQMDVFVSKVVEPGSPNARPGLEIGFKSAEDQAFVDQVVSALRASGVDGFTVARDRRRRAIGIRTQFIPEISARWTDDRGAFLDPAKVADGMTAWEDSARQALEKLQPEIRSRLSYERETYFDTRVFGREEYSTAPRGWSPSTLAQELGRRAQALAGS